MGTCILLALPVNAIVLNFVENFKNPIDRKQTQNQVVGKNEIF